MPRYSVTMTASAACNLPVTSSTTATFSARGFSMCFPPLASTRGCSHDGEHHEERAGGTSPTHTFPAASTSAGAPQGITHGCGPTVFGEQPVVGCDGRPGYRSATSYCTAARSATIG